MPSSPDGVTINFTFPNVEIPKIEIYFPYTTKVSEVINTLITRWPSIIIILIENDEIKPLEPNSVVRLICMGIGYLDESKSLQSIFYLY